MTRIAAALILVMSTAALALLIFYFGVHAFTGEGGLLRSNQRDATLIAKGKLRASASGRSSPRWSRTASSSI